MSSKHLHLFLIGFFIHISVPSHAWIPPVEFLVEEWASSHKLTTPLHLKFEGGLLNKNNSTSISFTQECFILPNGHLRLDLRFSDRTLTFIRNDAQVAILLGRVVLYEGAAHESLRYINLNFPHDKTSLFHQLQALNLFSSQQLENLAKEEKSEVSPSVDFRRKMSLTMYGNSNVAYSIPYGDSKLFLLDKVSLTPVGMVEGKSRDQNLIHGFTVREIKKLETPSLSLPQNVTFYNPQTIIHLNLSSVDPKTTMAKKWIELPHIMKSAVKGKSEVPDEDTQLFVRYLSGFY